MLYYHVQGPAGLVTYTTELARAVASARFYLRAAYPVRTWASYDLDGTRSRVPCPACGTCAC